MKLARLITVSFFDPIAAAAAGRSRRMNTGRLTGVVAALAAFFVLAGTHAIADSDRGGACCFEDGRCAEMSERECARRGGRYQGDGTNCRRSGCRGDRGGACCFEDGRCAMMSERECAERGGRYQGDRTSCRRSGCDDRQRHGACCLDRGCVQASERECHERGGEYQGDGTNCRDTGCRSGDANYDGCTDLVDLLAVLAAWGACPPPPEGCDADLDLSGDVGLTDLLAVLAGWGCD